jgi:hypothetical protein
MKEIALSSSTTYCLTSAVELFKIPNKSLRIQ